MYNPETDLLFPPRVIPVLRDARGRTWRELVGRVSGSDEVSVDKLAFIMMMVRLNGCASCNADSYRAMQGCTPCAKQSLKRFHGSDKDLLALFASAKKEVASFLQKEI